MALKRTRKWEQKHRELYKLHGPESPISTAAIKASDYSDIPICSATYGYFSPRILDWIDNQEFTSWRVVDDPAKYFSAINSFKAAKEPKEKKRLRKEVSEIVKARRRRFNNNRDQLMLAMLHAGRAYICSHPSCGEMRNLHLDHIIPLSKGGSDELSNLQFLCHKHNCEKGSKYPLQN